MMNEEYVFRSLQEMAATSSLDSIFRRQPPSPLNYPPESPTDPTQRFYERIPVELWTQIFIQCLPSSRHFPEQWASPVHDVVKLIDPPLIPMLLASVCRMWRHVACNTPCLWEVCWLSYKNPELNDIWLSRAGTRMLSLYGQSTIRTYVLWGVDGGEEASTAFLRSILAHRKRWKFVKLDIIPLARPLPDFVPIDDEASAFPALEYFEEFDPGGYDFERSRVETAPTWMSSILSGASSLRHLRLCDIVHYTLEQHKLPRLIHLDIRHISTRDVLAVSRALPWLQWLSFHLVHPIGGYNEIVHPRLTHNKLVQLCVAEDPGNEQENNILNYLRTPALRQLEAKNVPIRTIPTFLSVSQCQLTDLTISQNGRTLADHFVLDIFKVDGVNLSLKNLQIEALTITTELLDFLRYDSHNPRLILLERLSFKDCSLHLPKDGRLADCIISRCNNSINKSTHQAAQLRYVFMGTFRIPNESNPSCWHTQDLARLKLLPPFHEQGDDVCHGELVVYHANWSLERRQRALSIKFALE